MSVIWSGITDEGAIVPVQVDESGRVVSVEKGSDLFYWAKNDNTLTPADGENLLVDGTISSSVSFLGPTASFTEDININGLNVGRGLGGDESNTAFGIKALNSNVDGTNNTAIGEEALWKNTGGNNNVAVGRNSLGSNTTGTGNIAIGRNTLGKNTTSSNNTAIGQQVLFDNLTGSSNTALGGNALRTNISGSNNVSIGSYSLYKNTEGDSNIAIGGLSLRNSVTTSNNNGFGLSTLYDLLGGTNNTALGNDALSALVQGSSNTALGKNALANNTTGSNNTFVGLNPGIEGLNDTVCISAGTQERLWIDSEGQAGIGTNNPQATLDVAGPVLFANGLCGFLATGEIFFQSRNTTYKLVVASNGLVSGEEIPIESLRLSDRKELDIAPFNETKAEERLSVLDMDIDNSSPTLD